MKSAVCCALLIAWLAVVVGAGCQPRNVEYFPIWRNDLWGFINQNGREVVPPQYLKVADFNGDAFVAQRRDKSWVLVGPTGEQVIYLEDALTIHHAGDSLYRVIVGSGRTSIVDLEGRFQPPPGRAFVSVDSFFRENRIAVKDQEAGAWGYADREGRLVIEPRFASAFLFSEGNGAVDVDQDGQPITGYINLKGEFVIEPNPDFLIAGPFRSGVAVVSDRSDNAWFIDAEGQNALGKTFPRASEFSNGLALVQDPDSHLCGYIGPDGDYVIPPQFRSGGNFSDGLAAVQTLSDQFGYIDRSGTLVITIDAKPGRSQPHRLREFHRGLAWIDYQSGRDTRYGKTGCYINSRGKIVWSNVKD